MKHLTINCGVCLLATLGYAAVVSAHEGKGTLGSSPTATDYHQITCGAGSAHLAFQLHGGPPATAPTLSAQIQVPDPRRPGQPPLAVNVTDPVNGDVGSSQIFEVPGGATIYYLTVNKIGSGKASYSFTYHCESGSGDHTDTDIGTPQDQ